MILTHIVQYCAGLLLLLMLGFLFIVAFGLALESAWHFIVRILAKVQSIVERHSSSNQG